MHFTQTMKLGLAFAGLCAFGIIASPANAQTSGQLQRFTLSGVTFDDGATASGSFTYDPTQIGLNAPISVFDITTTNGLTDSTVGVHYISSAGSGYKLSSGGSGHVGSFVFNNLGLSGQSGNCTWLQGHQELIVSH